MNTIKKPEATYILAIYVSEDLKIRVGKLGELAFKKGDYLYIGSAKSCLETRLQRHLRKEKRIFWHIDYLLENQKAKILQIWAIDKKKPEKILKEIGFSVYYSFQNLYF